VEENSTNKLNEEAAKHLKSLKLKCIS